MVDATIGLDWNIEFTFLNQLYCCGASADCPLPKRSASAPASPFRSVDFAEKAVGFFSDYFENSVTRDDLHNLKTQSPELYNWYRERSSALHVGHLDNNHLLRQTDLILQDFQFRSLMGVKLGPSFVENSKTFSLAIEKLRSLASRIQIGGVQIAEPKNAEGARLLESLVQLLSKHNIRHDVIGDDAAERDRGQGGLVSRDEFDFYNEHALFFIGDRFYLNQFDHVLSAEEGFGAALDAPQFLIEIIRQKIKMYDRKAPRASGLVKDYFQSVVQSVRLQAEYTFLPRFMLNDQGIYYRKLVSKGLFHDTPHGLLRSGAKSVVPILQWS